MKQQILLLIVLLGTVIFSPLSRGSHPVSTVLEVSINSSINPATLQYLQSAQKKGAKIGANLIVMKLNTPGGLVSTTKEILTLIGDSSIPYLVWITPEAASATSAGAIISSGAHFLFMSPGTNIGAATPIQMGKDIPKDARAKAVNDLVALVSGLSKARGRNPKPFEKMISKAASYDDQKAKKEGIIDGIASHFSDIEKTIQGKQFTLKGEKKRLNLQDNYQYITHEMDLGQRLLNFFANPNMAYILFLLGAALLYFELQAPGGFIAGGIGILSLLLAGIAFQVLPINFGSLGLIVLAFVLFVIEIYVTSFGILSLAGLAALIFGSLFLFHGENGSVQVDPIILFSTIAGVATTIGFFGYFLLKDIRKQKDESFFKLVGQSGVIQDFVQKEGEQFEYQVKVSGEIWKAISTQEFKAGDKIKVSKQDRFLLTITHGE